MRIKILLLIDDKFLMLLVSYINNMGVTKSTCGVDDWASMGQIKRGKAEDLRKNDFCFTWREADRIESLLISG
jgi:hypothetical protein